MVIRITNPVLIDCGTGFEVAHGSDLEIEIEGGQFHRVQRLFNERDPISVHQRLGLPDSTPPEYLRELVLEVIRQKDNAQVSKEKIIKSSRLWSYVQNAANAAQVFESIVKFLDQMPEQISKMFTG